MRIIDNEKKLMNLYQTLPTWQQRLTISFQATMNDTYIDISMYVVPLRNNRSKFVRDK